MSSRQPNLLIVTQWYRPAYKAGGPITSLFNLVEQLKQYANITVLCGAHDLGESMPLEVNLDRETMNGGVRIIYTSTFISTFTWFNKLTRRIDFSSVYFNDYYSARYFVFPRIILWMNSAKSKPILALRGMLLPGALSYKSFKKKLYTATIRIFLSWFKTELHFTSKQEAYSSLKLLGKQLKHKTLPNLNAPLLKVDHPEKEVGKLILGYFGRISPVKNLDFLIEAINGIPSSYTGLELNIWGNIEDSSYFEHIKKLVQAESQSKIIFHGAFSPQNISGLLSKIHVTVCPSFSENYGHAIAQSLGHSVPVIATKNSPWQDLEKARAGLLVDPYDINTGVAGIQYMLDINQEQYSELCFYAGKFAVLEVANSEVLDKYITTLLH